MGRSRGTSSRAQPGRKRAAAGGNCQHRPLTEYDPAHDDVLFFGYVVGLEAELGYFTLSELAAIRGVQRLPVERDLYFEPCRLSEVESSAN